MTTSTEAALSVERLIRTACQVAMTTDDDHGNSDAGSGIAENAALERVQVLLTPAARVALIADLAAGLPVSRGKRLYLGVSPEVRSLVASLPGAKNGDTPGYATARVGELDVYAFHRSPVDLLADLERERQEKADPRIVAHPLTEGISSAVLP